MNLYIYIYMYVYIYLFIYYLYMYICIKLLIYWFIDLLISRPASRGPIFSSIRWFDSTQFDNSGKRYRHTLASLRCRARLWGSAIVFGFASVCSAFCLLVSIYKYERKVLWKVVRKNRFRENALYLHKIACI